MSLTNPADAQVQLQIVFKGENSKIAGELETIIPLSLDFVNEAIVALSSGLDGLSKRDRQLLLVFFDPAETGDIDSRYVETVLANYRRIKSEFQDSISIYLDGNSDTCEGMRLYYTDLASIHICPFFATESNRERKARTFLHEMAHRALLVLDRTYYRPTNKKYAELTPRGPFIAQLPLIGPIFREIARQDTLFHPDAYAHFAMALHMD